MISGPITAAHQERTYLNAKMPTCTEAGNKECYTCKGCGKYYGDQAGTTEIPAEAVVIRALGHDWGEWVTKKEATAGSEGLETRTCQREGCGQMESRAIPKHEIPVGSSYTVSGSSYKVISSRAVSLTKARKGKSFTLPATVKIDGKSFAVTQIGAKAFKGTKTTKLTVKTKKLTKKSVKGSLKGSKVKTVKVKVGKKVKVK
ncbi:MAG: hypothetical protein IJ128_03195 [Firmicutes bacterium]|nr:hypothetical protein [Bacillota bacterium]